MNGHIYTSFMKNVFFTKVLYLSVGLIGFYKLYAEEPVQNRGLWAFIDGSSVRVEWRMRAADDPLSTTYELYANDVLVGSYTDVTSVKLPSRYHTSTFKVVVKDAEGNLLDRQEDVVPKAQPYFDIPLSAPVMMSGATVAISYTPGDCSAYDMDGDGEQEIILKWMPSDLFNTSLNVPAHEFLDCYKLDGTRLWRIDLGQNVGAGNNLPFMCWDFDGDGHGEMIVKTAPGSQDASGKFVGESLTGYADIEKQYYRGSDKLPTEGAEWITCYSGVDGTELATIDYWPLFGIQSDWDNRSNSTDGKAYGRRGNGFKGAVIYIPVDGEVKPCCYCQRGIYTYIYAMALTWDGTTLKEVWRHTSDVVNQGLFSEGAHTGVAGDLDGDGYDEVCIGAAAIDHDGTVLWRTGLGHGDATHIGDHDLDNEGLEIFRITEVATKYDGNLMDGKTGKTLCGSLYTSGDVGRGLAMDLDPNSPGSEWFHMNSGSIFNCKGDSVFPKNMGKNNGYPNYRIFWDGDLLDEHYSGNVVSKYSLTNLIFERCTTPTSGTKTLWSLYKTVAINGTKENPCLQCDLFGDFREELVLFVAGENSSYACDYALRVITSTFDTSYKLPWLRDDHVYSLGIANQNVGYSLPPHLGYNAVAYYKRLENSTGLTSISEINKALPVAYYSLCGTPLPGPAKGVNVVRFSDGRLSKVFVAE